MPFGLLPWTRLHKALHPYTVSHFGNKALWEYGGVEKNLDFFFSFAYKIEANALAYYAVIVCSKIAFKPDLCSVTIIMYTVQVSKSKTL